jgi:hypothetical protein
MDTLEGHDGKARLFFFRCTVLITWPRSDSTCCLVQARYRTLNKWFMTVLLTHWNHGVLACRHCLLADRPIARHVPRVHAGVVGTLQTTFVAWTLLKLPCAISSRRNASEIEGIGCCAVTDDRLTLAQELVSNAKLKWRFLLNRWSVKHLDENYRLLLELAVGFRFPLKIYSRLLA